MKQEFKIYKPVDKDSQAEFITTIPVETFEEYGVEWLSLESRKLIEDFTKFNLKLIKIVELETLDKWWHKENEEFGGRTPFETFRKDKKKLDEMLYRLQNP